MSRARRVLLFPARAVLFLAFTVGAVVWLVCGLVVDMWRAARDAARL